MLVWGCLMPRCVPDMAGRAGASGSAPQRVAGILDLERLPGQQLPRKAIYTYIHISSDRWSVFFRLSKHIIFAEKDFFIYL